MHPNLRAFLDMLAWSEGTSTVKGSQNGYNVLFGGTLFTSYADHPRKVITATLKGRKISSSAAGRYQLLGKYFDPYKKLLNLPDFSPASQDAIALRQIREQGAKGAIISGDFDRAVMLCANIWASLPGAGYNQPEHDLETLRNKYQLYGGTLDLSLKV